MEPEITWWVPSLWKPRFSTHQPEILHTCGSVVCSEAGNQQKSKEPSIGSKGQEYSLATVTEVHQEVKGQIHTAENYTARQKHTHNPTHQLVKCH